MSSTTISKKLFENAEFVSSNDPNVDHDNLVYMDSDSEGSEKFNYDLSLQQTSLQEVVQADKEEVDVAIEITENLVNFPVKQEEEYIIEDVPYDLDSDIEEELDISKEDYVASLSTSSQVKYTLRDIKQDEEEEGEVNFGASTSFGGNSEICITRISPPPDMLPPSQGFSDTYEEQFEIINEPSPEPEVQIIQDSQEDSLEEKVDVKKIEAGPSVGNNSLVDHQYSQPETTNREFCDDLLQGVLKETGNAGNPSVLALLEKYNELFSHFVEEDQNSQMSLYIKSMTKTLRDFKKRLPAGKPMSVDPEPVPSSTNEEQQLPVTERILAQDSELALNENTNLCSTQSSEIRKLEDIDLPQTQSSGEDTEEYDVEAKVKMEVEKNGAQSENDNSKLKLEINRIKDFATKVGENATELLQLPMDNDEVLADAKKKLLTLAENSFKDYEKLVGEVRYAFGDKLKIRKAEEKNKKKIFRQMLDISEGMSTSESDDDQILNLNRTIQKNGPQTPAIVSSTKEDSDISEVEEKPEVARVSSAESGSEKEKDDGKKVDRLLDFATLNFAKPASSKKVSKKKILKKKKKKSDDTESIFGSSTDEDNIETDRSSSNEERDTSDEEQQMILRQNADIKNDLLAGSESSSVDEDESDFKISSSEEDDEELPEKEIKKNTQGTKKEAKAEENVDKEESESEKAAAAAVETSTPPSNAVQSPTKPAAEKASSHVEEVSLVSDDEDDDRSSQVEQSRPFKRTVKLNSAEREIFAKDFMEVKDLSKKGASTSSSSNNAGTNDSSRFKTENVSPSKPLNPQGTIDVSMFESRRAAREFDLEKMIERRHFPSEPSTSSSPSAQNQTKPIAMISMNDDECISLSSDSDSEISAPTRFPKRKKMLTEEELQEETKKANKDEDQRVKRLEKKNKTLSQMMTQRLSQESESEEELILDFDPKKKITIAVHPKLVKKLKDHQKEGIKFMYDTCYGSIADEVKTESGCILAHCMGLGKTLQLITLLHTLIMHPNQLKTSRVLVICPKSTITNWYEEFKKWISQDGIPSQNMKIAFLDDTMRFIDRIQQLEQIFNATTPVVLLINYEAYRNMIHYSDSKRVKNADQKEIKRQQDIIDKCLLNAPDLVVCDEGHLIKNQTGATNRAITKIKTRRRIILTGTPVQNNLNEYYSMVDFIKPALLGTVKEFNNLYGTPIKDGQHIDSDKGMIKKMKQRSFILNKKLSKFVQRKEASVLREYLPEKHEYCIFVPLTKVQENLYETFLRQNPLNGGHKLLSDYTALRKIWTHPKVLQNAYDRAMKGELTNEAKKRARDDVENDQAEDVYDLFDGNFGVKSKWWKDLVSEDDLESLLSSNKLLLLFEILRQCQERNEKVLVFSAFVAVLNVVEEFMRKMHNERSNPNASKYGYSRYQRSWLEGYDYYRLDGSTKRDARQQMIERFNDKKNTRMCCFLISARAGGQGINLTGANRCVILDTSWNPAADQQNIFRIYRLGQDKICYVYRLIALGTMEEKVYSRAITKQAMSGRVVDKQQIDRHYSMDELQQLYVLQKFDPSKKQTQPMPADEVLQYLLFHYTLQAFMYHDHDSLLENKPEQDLNEDEIKEAWLMYEQESNGPNARTLPGLANGNVLFNDHMRPDMPNFNNFLAGGAYAYQPQYFSHDYLQSIFNIGNTGFLNNIVPSTALANSSIMPSTSAVDVLTTSLLQNQYNNFSKLATGNGKAGGSLQQMPKRRQSTSKTKTDRQAIIKQLQGEGLHRIDSPTSRKNSLENVSILPDDPQGSHNFLAQNRSLSNNANKVLNELRKNKTLDVTRNVAFGGRKTPGNNPTSLVMQGGPSTSTSALRLTPVPATSGTIERYHVRPPTVPLSPAGATPTASKVQSVQPHSAPPPIVTRVIPNTTRQEVKKKISKPPQVKAPKVNITYQQPKQHTSTASLIQRSASNNSIHITPKTVISPITNPSQRSQSNNSIDLSKNLASPNIRLVDSTQKQTPRNQTQTKARFAEVSQTPQLNQVTKTPGTTKSFSQAATTSKNALKDPPLNLSNRSISQSSLNSRSSQSSTTSSAGGSAVTSPSNKIVMSPMMMQSARTSAAAPVNVKYVQGNSIKPSQGQSIQIQKNMMKPIAVSKIVSSQLPTGSTPRSVIQEASQNTIPQRDPKIAANGNVIRTVIDPQKKIKPNLPKGNVSGASNRESMPLIIKPTQQRQPVTFTKALNNARSLQAGISQEISVHKIPKTTPTSNPQQPTATVIRQVPQKRQGEPLSLISPAAKRPNIGARPLKVTSRDELNRANQDSFSIIEDIVELE